MLKISCHTKRCIFLFYVLLRFSLRLRDCVRAVEKKGYYFLKQLVPDVHRAVHAVGGLRPVHFADCNFPRQGFAAIAKLDAKQVAAQYHRDAMEWVAMPGRGFARGQPLPTNQVIPAMMQYLLL
jgi:hypothetical protein